MIQITIRTAQSALSDMHHLTCGISSLHRPVNLIMFTPII